MQKYKIVFLPESYKDLDHIFDYILLDSVDQAKSILDRIMNSIATLRDFPISGTKLHHKSLNYYNFQMVIIKPYIVFYRFIDDTIYIYRILYGARDYIDALRNI